ncbi:MAG: glycosyltransferase [Candidatus Krumholzibacteriia bacterium]
MNIPHDSDKDTNPPRPRVSVIIPCYNGERFVGEAIECVLGQSFHALEIVVVDDGSADGSKAVVQSYAAGERVTCVEHGKNRGIAAARNTGIKATHAEYVAFLDQDDLWRVDKLERQLEVLDREDGVGLVFSGHQTSLSGGAPRAPRGKAVPRDINRASKETVLRTLFLKNYIPMASAVIRRTCFDDLGLLDERIRSGADDYEFCMRLVSKYRVYHIDEPLLVRRVHGSNFTDDERLAPDGIAINRRLALDHPELAPLRARRESELLFKLGRALQRKGKRAGAKKAYRDAVRVRPAYLKALLAFALCNLGRFGDGVLNRGNRIRTG